MWTWEPGQLARFVGTAAVVLGALTIMVNADVPNHETPFFVAGLLVIGGVLLRIEGAIAAAQRKSEPKD